LLLKAGVAPHVVQQRLGHKRIEMALGIYAPALPSMQQDAARKLGHSCTADLSISMRAPRKYAILQEAHPPSL